MTREQKYAMDLLRRGNGPGVLTANASNLYDGQPWIHWRTAYALHAKGLVEITDYGEETAEVHLLGSRER